MRIETRIVLIVGPSSQGKTTLAKRLEQELPGRNIVISHDEVLEGIDKDQPQEIIDLQFRETLLDKICEAADDITIDHIILDTVNRRKRNLATFIYLIRESLLEDEEITLIKLNIPESLNLEYGKKHYPNMANVSESILIQRAVYQGEQGSLNTSFQQLVEFEYVIENPNELSFV